MAVTDPRNLGAVVRSAAAFGVDGVIITERRAAAMTASAWKSSGRGCSSYADRTSDQSFAHYR
jgi:tRNA G18 (ribose-2'-O)-methylase SpoU